jgi:hypothetical protein
MDSEPSPGLKSSAGHDLMKARIRIVTAEQSAKADARVKKSSSQLIAAMKKYHDLKNSLTAEELASMSPEGAAKIQENELRTLELLDVITLKHVAHAEFGADAFHIDWLALECKRSIARDNEAS